MRKTGKAKGQFSGKNVGYLFDSRRNCIVNKGLEESAVAGEPACPLRYIRFQSRSGSLK